MATRREKDGQRRERRGCQAAREESSCDCQEDSRQHKTMGLPCPVPGGPTFPYNTEVERRVHEWERQQLHVSARRQDDHARAAHHQERSGDTLPADDLHALRQRVEHAETERGGEGVDVLLGWSRRIRRSPGICARAVSPAAGRCGDVPDVSSAFDLRHEAGDVMIRQLAVERDVEGKARNEDEQRLEPEAGARRGRNGDRVAHGAGMQLVKAIPLFRTGVGASLRGRLFRGIRRSRPFDTIWTPPTRVIGTAMGAQPGSSGFLGGYIVNELLGR